ncbi:uncharacterized protein LOC132754765 [Ruditapes philippinarum]|uniref:uncharacterized protein LOC132754765 n=1 Tax=Ruditapes philippinarum TaxID=129788 RepID=UPI00295AE3A8|nr:uncharacterized protein LOC132754765 [Ruditapes philippinarum]
MLFKVTCDSQMGFSLDQMEDIIISFESSRFGLKSTYAPVTAPTPPDTPPTSKPRAPTPPATQPTSTPRAPTPPATPPTSTPRAPTSEPRTPTPPATPPTSTPRAPTPPALPPKSTPRAPTSEARAPSPPATPPTSTPRSLTPPATPPTSTPRALTPPATPPTSRPRAPTSAPRAPSPPGTLPTSKPRAPTPPATPSTSTPRAPTPTPSSPTPPATPSISTSRAPTPTPRAPTPTAMPPISTPRAPTPTPKAPPPLAMPLTPTPRAPTRPARAPSPPPVIPIQQQADMAQQLAKEQAGAMTHEKHLKNNKYRQWVKAGLGLGYLKEGLAQFCDDIGKQQHEDIIKYIQQTKNPKPNVACGFCKITTLQPDHVRVSKGKCPLGQDKCNCCFPNNKKPCPNNVCGAIYDNIIRNHASNPPAPFWKNSDAAIWSTDKWSICKCFINAPGYNDKASAFDTDCSGLLHVIINNKYFHNHIGCNVTAPNNLFLEVRHYRNKIFHSSNMELEETEANSYICDMISVLQDSKELVHHPASQQAVRKLQDLKTKDFIITTEGVGEILRQIKETAVTKDEYEELKNRITDIETQLSKEKEVNQRLKIEDARQQKQLEYEQAKSVRLCMKLHYRIRSWNQQVLSNEGNNILLPTGFEPMRLAIISSPTC